MNVKNQELNLTGEKLKSLVFVENGIQLLHQSDPNKADSNKIWNLLSNSTDQTEIPFNKISNITQVVGTNTLKIHYQNALGILTMQQIAFQKAGDQQVFYQFFQKEKGFVKTDKKLSCLESTMHYLIPLVIILVLTAIAYNYAMELTSGHYAPPETISRSTRIFQLILEVLGAGGVVSIGFALATYCVYKGWKHYFNPPVITKLEFVQKKK
jgi:hypothetical protein